jgi:hypothetical protein
MIARMPTWAEVDARVQADVVVLSAPRRTRYLIGLHLGQAQDYSAWVVAKRNERDGRNAAYDIGHLDRVQGARYPAHEPRADIELVVDFTGVGRAVADLLVDEIAGADVELVTITGGDAVTRGEHGEWRVPKRDLASVVQVLLQSSRLRIAAGLAHAHPHRGAGQLPRQDQPRRPRRLWCRRRVAGGQSRRPGTGPGPGLLARRVRGAATVLDRVREP